MQPQSLLRRSRRYYWLSAYTNGAQVATRRSRTLSAATTSVRATATLCCCPCCCSCI